MSESPLKSPLLDPKPSPTWPPQPGRFGFLPHPTVRARMSDLGIRCWPRSLHNWPRNVLTEFLRTLKKVKSMAANSSSPPQHDSPARLWRFADCELDELRRQLRVHGSLVELESKPLDVLIQLLHHAGEVVTRSDDVRCYVGIYVGDGQRVAVFADRIFDRIVEGAVALTEKDTGKRRFGTSAVLSDL